MTAPKSPEPIGYIVVGHYERPSGDVGPPSSGPVIDWSGEIWDSIDEGRADLDRCHAAGWTDERLCALTEVPL